MPCQLTNINKQWLMGCFFKHGTKETRASADENGKVIRTI